MDKETKQKLEQWVRENYDPAACGHTEFRPSGNDPDVFYDGYNCGTSDSAYEIGCILNMKLKEPEKQDYKF